MNLDGNGVLVRRKEGRYRHVTGFVHHGVQNAAVQCAMGIAGKVVDLEGDFSLTLCRGYKTRSTGFV